MTITNGYCTLNDLKHALNLAAISYTAATIAFDNGASTITDSANGLLRFDDRTVILVAGSGSNDGYFDVTANADGQLTVSPAPADEAAGASVTITDVTDINDDDRLEAVVEAVSRSIDDHCKRRFFTTSADESREFTASHARLCFVDDLVSITSVKTDDNQDYTYETTWSAGDYRALPSDAGLDNNPYLRLMVPPRGTKSFPTHVEGVQITGKFGRSAAPDPVREACILWSMRCFKRKDAVFGVSGSSAIGVLTVTVPPPDPDVKTYLAPYIKGRNLI